mmetsp:Transcript_97815/g.282216  ORF Transcript_97815/g.282216 Transcript_97815/m.282216 type:complete len:87 (-) Transcript_97815:21-281(-)
MDVKKSSNTLVMQRRLKTQVAWPLINLPRLIRKRFGLLFYTLTSFLRHSIKKTLQASKTSGHKWLKDPTRVLNSGEKAWIQSYHMQ